MSVRAAWQGEPEASAVVLAFRDWAAKSNFVEGRHDAELTGKLDGIEVVIDTGVRDTTFGPPTARLAMVGREPAMTIRVSEDEHDDDFPVRALRAIARRDGVTIWIDADRLVVHRGSSEPNEFEATLRDVITTWRDARSTAYR